MNVVRDFDDCSSLRTTRFYLPDKLYKLVFCSVIPSNCGFGDNMPQIGAFLQAFLHMLTVKTCFRHGLPKDFRNL